MGPALRHWLCGPEGRGEDHDPADSAARGSHPSCARCPPVRSGPAPHAEPDIPADGFTGADRRDRGAYEELSAAQTPPGVPKRGRGGPRVRTRRSVRGSRSLPRAEAEEWGAGDARGAELWRRARPLRGAPRLLSWGGLEF